MNSHYSRTERTTFWKAVRIQRPNAKEFILLWCPSIFRVFPNTYSVHRYISLYPYPQKEVKRPARRAAELMTRTISASFK